MRLNGRFAKELLKKKKKILLVIRRHLRRIFFLSLPTVV